MELLEFDIGHFHDSIVALGTFWWMIWNAALALIPVILSFFFFKRAEQPRPIIRDLTFFFEIVFVLLFLPNAPYIATDLVHFLETVRTGDVSLWKLLGTQLPIYVIFVLFGLTCYSFTVDRVVYAIRMRLGRSSALVALFVIPLLCSIGVYLGRVARYNSWDILVDPTGVIQSSTTVLDQSKIAKVLISMWFGLIVIHQVYRTFHDGVRTRMAAYRAALD
jgi:uncharacterized membrane protein